MQSLEITKQQSGKGGRDSIDQFLEQCTSCGVCRSECSFLENHGTPDEIITRNEPKVFFCTNCGRCSSVCPSGLLPSEALYRLKTQLLENRMAGEEVLEAVRTARRFIAWGSSPPFVHYPRTRTVFWPGCSLAGMAPDLIPAVGRLLEKQFGEEVGIALDCCGDPAYELGDRETARRRTGEIEGELRRNGITTIIAGCANCVKVLHAFLPDLAVRHILEVLPASPVPRLSGQKSYLHHPCPSYRFPAIQAGARRHYSAPGPTVPEQTVPQCCGQGGGLPAISAARADACTGQVFDAAGPNAIVTYCMGCKDQFLRKGRRAYHLLELVLGTEPSQKVFSSLRKWVNRLRLSVAAKL